MYFHGAHKLRYFSCKCWRRNSWACWRIPVVSIYIYIYVYMFLIVLEDEPPVGLDSIHVLSLSSRYKMCRIVWNVLCVKTYVSISCWMSTTSNFKNFEYLNILLRFPRRWIAKLWSSKDTNFNFGTMSIQTRNTTFFLHSVSKEDPKKIFIVYNFM